MRCFVAVDVSDATRALATRIRLSITETDPAWQPEKWVMPENLHLTLAFLGDVEDEGVRELVAALRGNSLSPFELSAPTLVAVPATDRASMIWIRYLDGLPECSRLAAYVSDRALDLGMLADAPGRPFSPHVTLVRARTARRLSHHALSAAQQLVRAASETSVSVPSVRVFSSSIGRVGPTYTLVAEVPLNGTDAV